VGQSSAVILRWEISAPSVRGSYLAGQLNEGLTLRVELAVALIQSCKREVRKKWAEEGTGREDSKQNIK
jgi:hypothetical protein